MAPASLLELIGNTPLLPITRIDTGPCELFIKLESQNPGGSIKDRIAVSMIDAAERDGRIRPGGTLIEATAGNTGLALALVGLAKGYRTKLVIPDKMSQEKIFHLRALGAEIIMTRSDVGKGHPEYYQDMAEAIAVRTPNSVYINQFGNPANPDAHEKTTGPEIWAQTGERLDAVVCGVGSGGTLTGLTRYFRSNAPHVKMVLADPAGSVLAHFVRTGEMTDAGAWLVEGIGEDFVPPIADLSGVAEAYTIDDAESFATARELLATEGILAGSSSGTLLAAALRYCRSREQPERVVTFACDSGNKYLSKMFNDFWMYDQGFLTHPAAGGLTDLVQRRYAEGSVVTVRPDDTLLTAFGRFKLYQVSQLPVLDGNDVVGIIDESDVLHAVVSEATHFGDTVSSVMSTRLETLQPDAPLARVVQILDQGMVAIVMDGDSFVGLITRIDLLNHLRRRVKRP
ncbi:pyridoxal-phosphate dependent enzyme [Aromatoleum bremense]|uniref:Pyridoxal-phosphate dependent enzyme n=1 Tax=Aromatoleum bremense TaxID=76115 RepID=A0ABX1NRE1_9RHOO|nr:cystathionine beta-synthase [Aromatoleum bremense]NMG14563.1 pyridoxal-phosphate dependent enzyme [Aromatoleum bremense]QTQ32734.1 putative cystathionine beta-synthase [Aromatoleum bremense]